MSEHTTEIPVAPVPKPRMTQSDKWKKRPAVLRYRQFKDDLRKVIKGTLEPRFIVVFYIAMPLSWSVKKRLQFDGKPHQARPDVDNLCKALMDSLCLDDSYVFDVHAQKFWAQAGRITLTEIIDE